MKNQHNLSIDSAMLRERAEELLKRKSPGTASPSSEADFTRLIHELEVHQLELEMQNEQLSLTISAVRDEVALYDFAPCGYFTLSGAGEIIRLNLAGSQMLGKDRSGLITCNFAHFVSDDSRPVFLLFLTELMNSKQKKTCEVILSSAGERMFVHLSGIAITNEDRCLVTAVDLTEHRQAEQSLAESEIKYRRLIENSPDAIGIYADGKIVLVNKECLRLTGAKNENELIGKSVIEFVHPDYLELVTKRMNAAADQGEIFPLIEEKIVRFDGSTVDIELKAMPILFGNKPAVQLIIRNISERKRSEEELRNSRIFLDSIIEHSPNALWISDESGTLIRMNQSCRRMLHLRDEEVVGRYNILKDNLLEKQGLMPLVKDVFEKGRSVRFVTSYDTGVIESVKLENTVKIILDVNISPILNPQGKVIHAIIQEIDITEHRQAQEALLKSKQQYDNLVAKIPVGVYILHTWQDGTFALDYASPKMAEMLNLSVESLLTDNKTIFKAIHPDDLDGFMTLNQEGIYKQRPFDWKGRIMTDGTVKWMHFRSTPELIENGDTLWHGLIVDITERNQAEQEIQLKNEELSRLVAEKDKFFSIIAHDLRSPFNVLLGFTQMLADDLSGMSMDQVQQVASILKSSARNVYVLLENLLEWSRMQQSLTSFYPQSFHLMSRISKSLQSALEPANKKGIEINTYIPDDLLVFADSNMLESVIRNLVLNAVKFTQSGGKVTLAAKSVPGNMVEVSVSDTGIGMNKTLLDQLFILDARTSRKGTDNEPSTGLGLIICKDFIARHGGSIRVESEEGTGSTFYFTIPCDNNNLAGSA